jgi:hypothetical protein
LKDKELTNKLIGIFISFNTGGFDNATSYITFIPMADFEEIYSKNES